MSRRYSLKFALNERTLDDIEMLSGQGLSSDQIANYFGLNFAEWDDLKKKHPDIKTAIIRGRARTISFTCAKLLDKIDAGNIDAIKFYLRSQAGWNDRNGDNVVINNQDVASQKIEINTLDANEASKIYSKIMLGS